MDRISETKDDDREQEIAGKLLSDLPPADWPACVQERNAFMAPHELIRPIDHPYSETSTLHNHILATDFRQPPYSAAAIPFRWMNRESAWELAAENELDADPGREPKSPKWLADSHWVQNYENQKAMLDGFFHQVQPEKSLCFFYAKQTPLSEEDDRIIIGVGRIRNVGRLEEYDYEKPALRACIWDRLIQHSIRPDFHDGFLLPYQAILEKAETDPTIDLSYYLALAPEDRRIEFSYATEHVSHDGAIAALLSCKEAIEKSSSLIDGSWEMALNWIDARLAELWKMRGPYPGLGVALTAFGISQGTFMAYELAGGIGENEDPWPQVDRSIAIPSSLPPYLAKRITLSIQKKWRDINKNKPERLALLKLISRMEISPDQAMRFYTQEERLAAGIKCSDGEIIANPYLFYELDRHSLDPISLMTVDRGIFPQSSIREVHPLPKPSLVDDPTDSRRVRAFIIRALEDAAARGHTLLPKSDIVKQIRDMPVDPECPIDGDLLDAITDSLPPEINVCDLCDGSPAYQLGRFHDIGSLIRDTVERRIAGKRHYIPVDWRKKLDLEFKDSHLTDDENAARIEKAAALKELAESRFSVLIGSAGTGKTALLSVLCKEPYIKAGGVLLLAPTGKARVRLQQSTGLTAQTIAQFLRPLDRFNEITGEYRLSDMAKISPGKTAIIDEASMLTEEQIGSLLDAIKGVERLILVGDPKQLPPIGAGRPFVDIVHRLMPENIESTLPRIGNGYAELIVTRRQTTLQSLENRQDLQLADWFSGRSLGPGEDEILSNITHTERIDSTLKLVQWTDHGDLNKKLLQVLIEEIDILIKDLIKDLAQKDLDDTLKFALSLGGVLNNGYAYHNPTNSDKDDKKPGSRKEVKVGAEAWQILSPVKGMAHGVRDLNRLIQKAFRSSTIKFARSWYGKIPKPMGPECIVYGDKVINIVNHHRKNVSPMEGSLGYVANGEIGIAVGQFNSKSSSKPWRLQVEFSSQPGFTYDYTSRDFSENGNPILELAYAITVHKAQGSEFGLCLLVLPNPCKLLSRELLYTALTRQRDKIIILHQGDLSGLKRYASDFYSETAQRYTNLFRAPTPIEIDGRFYEENLIHCSGKGESMRSKSEVIVADSLAEAGIEYDYELPLHGNDGMIRYPDFTIEDAESGLIYYWEHCGMLSNPQYRKRWEKKLEWYHSQDILPRDKGGGEKGTLIVTSDSGKGGINSMEIKNLIREIWG